MMSHTSDVLIIRKLQPLLLALSVLIMPLTAVTAQESQGTPKNTAATAIGPATRATQNSLASLANLPEADTLVYFNPQRILNDAAPRVLAEADLAKLRERFESLKEDIGVDPSKVDYVVIALRFKKPSAELSFTPPEFLVLTSGDFSADSLLILGKIGSNGRLYDEKYGSKTISLIKVDEALGEAGKNPFTSSYSTLAVASINANTIGAGSPAYVKAALDASDGKGRISGESLNSLLRDPNALISIAGSPLMFLSKSFGLLGTEANARAAKCDSKLGDFYAAVTLEGTNFRLRGLMNADNPDTARLITNLLSGLLAQDFSLMKDNPATPVLKSFKLTPQENEILVQADVPQQLVANFVREQMKRKAKPPAKTGVKRHSRRRTPVTRKA